MKPFLLCELMEAAMTQWQKNVLISQQDYIHLQEAKKKEQVGDWLCMTFSQDDHLYLIHEAHKL